MAALTIDVDDLFLANYENLDWVSDVSEYKCTRCGKVLVQHFIANCEHKFCDNCKSVVHDGSQKWKCTKCHEYIINLERQDPHFKDKVMHLQLRCPNRKNGCNHICCFKDFKEHIERCGYKKERVLPVFYNENVTFEMFRSELQEVQQKMTEMERRNAEVNKLNEHVWDLGVEVNEMKRMMQRRKEIKQNDGEEKFEDKMLRSVREETNRFKKQIIISTPESLSSTSSEDYTSRILKLETKTDTWFEILEFNNWKINELMHRLKYEFERELKTKEIETKNEIEKFEQIMNEIAISQERKWAETKEKLLHTLKDEKKSREKLTSNVNKNSLQLLTLNAQTDSLSRDLQNQVLKPLGNIHKRLETLTLSLDDMYKRIVAQERKMAEVEGRIDQFSEESSSQKRVELNLQKKINLTEEKNILEEFLSPAQRIFNSFIKPENHHHRIVGEYYIAKPDFTWVVNAVKSLENGSQKELLSNVFPLRGYPFGAQAKMTLYANSFQFYLSYKDINKTNRQIRIQPIPNIYLTLKDQSNAKEKRDVIGTHYFTYYKEKLEYNTFYPLYLRNVGKRTLNSPIYNTDEEVVLDIHVEAPDVAQLVYSYDGTLTWAIDNYCKRKQLATDGLIVSYLSPYFYTHSKGYRVRVRVYLNGYDEYEIKGLTIAFALLTGVYDDQLDEDFPHKATVTVFDPTQLTRNISKSVNKDTRNCHWINMGTHEEIEKLLYNDTLFYKVTVEANKFQTK